MKRPKVGFATSVKMNKERIVVLGHRGFIGGFLHRKFCEHPHWETHGISTREVDLLKPEEVDAFFRHCNEETTLIFSAAIGRAKQDDEESFLKNITMAVHVAEALKKYPLKQCIFLSSIDVYGTPTKLPLHEKSPISPEGYYAFSKMASEFILQKGLSSQKTILTLLRLSGVYGPGNVENPVSTWLKTALEKGQISLFGDGSERRDYVWLADLYPFICQLIEKRIAGIFNVATGESYSLLEIIDRIRKIVPKPVEVIRSERKRPWLDYQFNSETLQKIIGPFSWTPLQEGLKSLHATFTNQ